MAQRQDSLNSPPLVHGSRRGKPGRPRNGDLGIFGKQELGHSTGTATMKHSTRSGDRDGTEVSRTVAPVMPRLLDLPTAASYLGLSVWTVREMEHSGMLPSIRLPLLNGEIRKLLFDKHD